MSAVAIPPKITLWELKQLYQGRRIIGLDGHDGKTLFDNRNNTAEYISKYHDAEVLCIWVDLKTEPHSVFSGSSVEPVLMCYLSHNSWKGEEG